MSNFNGMFWLVWLAAFIEGLCASAMNSLAFNLPLKLAKPNEKDAISSGFWVVIGLSGSLGNLLSGFLMEKLVKLKSIEIFGGIILLPFHIILLISAVFRLISIIPLVRIREENASKFKDMLPDVIPMLFRLKKKENSKDKTGTDDQ